MLLLDRVAQCRSPLRVEQADGSHWELSGPADFSRAVADCPLRYVLSDELVCLCVELAYSGGDELAGCQDLLHIPAERLWIEWSDQARGAAVRRLVPTATGQGSGRAGVLLSSAGDSRHGFLSTFWQAEGDEDAPALSPVETLLDLDAAGGGDAADALLSGRPVTVSDPLCPAVDRVLHCASFRLRPDWRSYYEHAATDAASRNEAIRSNLSCAFDVPMLLALLLLLGAGAALSPAVIERRKLNLKRHRNGKQPLLDHVLLSAPLFAPHAAPGAGAGDTLRSAPRMHHVRGHLVRRRDTIYWRSPHWRGHLRLGAIRSRTVRLQLSA